MSGHTPGPWTLEAPERGGRVMAGDYVVHDPPGGPRHPELRADAQLIAAAPDLLAALEAVLPHVELVGLAEQARAAVKKARGDS